MMPESQENILIIKLSALGDFIQNLGIMRAIREHHKHAHIALLTTKPYKDLALKSGYVNEVLVDSRPKFYQLKQWISLKKNLNTGKYSTVYDLQINDRTALYYSLFNPKPNWVGAISKQARDKHGFAFDRHKKMIEKLGIQNINFDTLDWMDGDINIHPLQDKYALIVPGCAPTRPEKRWPASHYSTICQKLIADDIQPVLIGTKDEEEITQEIARTSDNILNLTGKTSLYDIAPLARGAQFAIGNDTGPMHIIGPTGCQSLVLFSSASDPEKHAPMGKIIETLQADNITDISPDNAYKVITSKFI